MMSMDPRAPWWTAAAARALLSDLIADELARLRPGAVAHPDRSAPAAPDLLETLDSLEMLDVATSVAVRFQLYDSGQDRDLLNRRRLDDWVDVVRDSPAMRNGTLVFLTSGSTGQARPHVHPLAWLEEEIDSFAARLADCRRVLRAVPVHHIYGFLFGILLPARLGVPVHDVRDALPGGTLARAEAGDALIAHPAWLDLALRGPVAVAPGVTVVTSTAPCPAAVWRDLRTGGVSRVLEIYGASETAGIGVRAAPDAPFALLAHWSRRAGADDTIVRRDAAGEPVARALPDHVRWSDARHFQVAGRRDGAVQVGGVNVFPQRVRRCLLDHPEVADAGVRPDSPARGGRLKAFVVPRPECADPAGLPARLRAWCAGRLTPAEQPRAITLGPALPQSPLGKLLDWGPSPDDVGDQVDAVGSPSIAARAARSA